MLKWLNLSQSLSGGIEFVFVPPPYPFCHQVGKRSHRTTGTARRFFGGAAPAPPKKITSYKDFADPWLGSADLGFITADCTNVLSRFQLTIACVHLIRIDVRLF